MELAALEERMAACMAIDWAKFFDSIEREVRTKFHKHMMAVDGATQEERGWLQAENKLMKEASHGFKVGRAVKNIQTTRGRLFPATELQHCDCFSNDVVLGNGRRSGDKLRA